MNAVGVMECAGRVSTRQSRKHVERHSRWHQREAELGQQNHLAQTFNVRFWHLADIEYASENVRFRG